MSIIAKALFDIIDTVANNDQNAISFGHLEVERDIIYDYTHMLGKLDIYAKHFDSSVKHPLIINYHGGGFVAGDKKYRKGFADYLINNLADENVYLINANYRLCDGKNIIFPTPIVDSSKVLKWVWENATKYNFDLENVFLCGDSAGAYVGICMLNLSLDNDLAERIDAYKPPFRFKGGLLGCGPYNIISSLKTSLLGVNVGQIVGKPVTGLEEVNDDSVASYHWLHEIEPMNFVSREYPELFLIHAEHDEFCPNHGKILLDRLNELGVKNNDYFLSEKLPINHCFFLSQKNEKGKEALEESVKYFKRKIHE